MRIKADLTLFLVAIIWGSAFVAQRVAGQAGEVYLFNGARYILAGLVVLPFVKRSSKFLPRQQFAWMGVAGFFLFVASALQQAGMLYTTAGNAGFLTSLYVVLVPVVLFVGWREKPHWILLIAVVLAGRICCPLAGSLKSRRVTRWRASGSCSGRCTLSCLANSPRVLNPYHFQRDNCWFVGY